MTTPETTSVLALASDPIVQATAPFISVKVDQLTTAYLAIKRSLLGFDPSYDFSASTAEIEAALKLPTLPEIEAAYQAVVDKGNTLVIKHLEAAFVEADDFVAIELYNANQDLGVKEEFLAAFRKAVIEIESNFMEAQSSDLELHVQVKLMRRVIESIEPLKKSMITANRHRWAEIDAEEKARELAAAEKAEADKKAAIELAAKLAEEKRIADLNFVAAVMLRIDPSWTPEKEAAKHAAAEAASTPVETVVPEATTLETPADQPVENVVVPGPSLDEIATFSAAAVKGEKNKGGAKRRKN